jgi:Protein of unknown function (DUF1525)
MARSQPLQIDVVAYAPAAFFHCMSCELVWQTSDARSADRREQLDSSLPEDLKQRYQQLSDWVRHMVARYGRQLRFRIVDAASIEGWFKSLRYGIRQYPAVIVAGREKSVGTEFERATALIERRLAAAHG